MSTVTYGPPVVIDGPLPVAPLHNVFTVAQEIEAVVEGSGDIDQHWIAGGALYGYPSDPPVGFDPCSTGSGRQKGDPSPFPTPTFGTFTAYLATACSAMGIDTWERFKQRANIALLATDAWAAERQLIRGDYLPLNPYLADPNATAPDGGAVSATPVGPTEGLALLEDAIARTGRMGVIHATPATVTAWNATGTELVEQAGLLRTKIGTPIVVGYGYVDFDDPIRPDGQAAPADDQAWAWASGPLVYRRGDDIVEIADDIRQNIDTSNNDLVYRAERDLFIAWDTALQAAVLIDRGL